MAAFPGSIAFDEFGKPFIILRDQGAQKRLTGNDAIKVSFGPLCNGRIGLIIVQRQRLNSLWMKIGSRMPFDGWGGSAIIAGIQLNRKWILNLFSFHELVSCDRRQRNSTHTHSHIMCHKLRPLFEWHLEDSKPPCKNAKWLWKHGCSDKLRFSIFNFSIFFSFELTRVTSWPASKSRRRWKHRWDQRDWTKWWWAATVMSP